MIGYTDYPIGGIEGIHEIAILAYDRNKYVRVSSMDQTIYDEVKRGYIWRDKEMTRRFPSVLWQQLPYEEGGKSFTKKDAHQAVMADRRKKKTHYVVMPDDRNLPVKKFTNLRDALRCFAKVEGNACLTMKKDRKMSWSTEPLMDKEGTSVIPYASRRRNGHSILKNRHIKMMNKFK